MSDPVARLTSALADRYHLGRELGQGGMATVYLAEDLRHGRKVAIKVLHPELSAVLGGERFLAEIKVTANLQHPHILGLIDSGEADGLLYYVMPYVAGESLRARLAREKQLPVEEAVRLAREVASALDYAHRQGVVHRDIKPEKTLLQDGTALVADFGIALAVQQAGGSRMTQTGMSLGTPAYMSPEQAMGEREIGPRSDVYALGAMTYEMLAGEPPFTGPNSQAIVAKVLTEPAPPLRPKRPTVSAATETAILTALQKLPADRWGTAKEFSDALAGVGPRPGSNAATVPLRAAGRGAPSRARPAAPWLGWALAAVSLAVAGWALLGRGGRAGDRAPVAFAFRSGPGTPQRPYVAISPDGRRILQAVADSGGEAHIVMRDLGSTRLVTIAGTEGARDPEFSPDGSWIAFVAVGKLWKVPVGGGPPTLLADSVIGAPGWGDDGTILYTRRDAGLWRVASSGGVPQQLTTLDPRRREFSHWFPQILPGGRTAIFNNFSTPMARSRIEAVDLASGRRTVLLDGAVYPRYVAAGHLLFVRDGAIFAVPFDPGRVKILGAAVPVVDSVAWAATDGVAGYAVSRTGTLVYLDAAQWNFDRRVIWSDRAGNETAALPGAGPWAEPRLSPDGRWIATTRINPGQQIWLFDLRRSVLTQLTHAEGVAFNAVWMPDSRSVIYTSETPVYDLHRIRIDGTTPDTVLATEIDKFASSVSPDGRMAAYTEASQPARLGFIPLAGGGKPTPFEPSALHQWSGMFSPDGHWLAYQEVNLKGHGEVYVRALEGAEGRRQVSADGASQPRWSRGGREIIYRKGEAVLAASFDPATGDVGTPAVLFRKPDAGRLGAGTTGYDVTPDGSRFLLVVPVEHSDAQPTVVVLHWADRLKHLRP